MRKLLLTFSVLVLCAIVASAQSPYFFNYQGVARNSVGNALVGQVITLRLTIRDGGAIGTPVYTETRQVTTNNFGLFSVQIGGAGASNVSGTISATAWYLGAKWLQVEIDPNGGTTFKDLGSTQLISVPYSLYSNQTGDIVLPFNKSQNEEIPLFRLTNTGNNASSLAYEGLTNSTANNATAIRGVISSNVPGSFSSGISGRNNGTGGNGFGVHGYQNGTGAGVYGETPGGIGVYGASTTGIGVYGQSLAFNASVKGYKNDNGQGHVGFFENISPINHFAALKVQTNGPGDGFNVGMTGIGKGAVISIANAANTANLMELTTNGTGSVVVMSNTNATNTNNVIDIRTNGLGKTGFLQNTNAANAANAFEVQTAGTGRGGLFQNTNGANASNVLEVQTNGTGKAGFLQNTNTSSLANIFEVQNAGLGRAGYFQNTNASNGNNIFEVQSNGAGKAVLVQNSNASNITNVFEVHTNGSGRVALLENTNPANTANALEVRTGGAGKAALIQNTNAANGANIFEVQNNGTGKGALIQLANAGNASNALHVQTNGTGYAAYIQSTNAVPMGLRSDGRVLINDATQSTSTTTGALVVNSGGLGLVGNLNVGGASNFGGPVTFGSQVRFTDPTESVDPTTGTVIVTGGVGIGKRLNVQGNGRFYSALNVDGVTTMASKLNVNAQVTITANPGSGTDALFANYPLQVTGGNQGIAIRVNGSRNNNNNFISFWDGTQMWGRIEGQTLGELANDPDYQVEKKSLELAKTMAAIDVATGAVGVIMAGIDLVGASTSSTPCAGLGVCVTAPVPSLIVAATLNLAAAIANEVAVAIGLDDAITQYDYFINTNNANIGVTYQSGSGDYAEWLPKADKNEVFKPGYVVGLKNGRITLKTEGADKLFVISTRPIVLGNMPAEGKESDFEKVAFMGQVPVHVIGKVKAGDYILPSGHNNGFARAVSPENMKPADYALIIGMAWSSSGSDHYGVINAAIGLNNGDVSKLVLSQNAEIDALKSQISQTNALLAKLVPGFREAAGIKDPVTVSIPMVKGNTVTVQGHTAEIVKPHPGTIIYFEVTDAQIAEGLTLAEKAFTEKGVDVSQHPFWKRMKNDASYKTAVMQMMKKKVTEALHYHEATNKAASR
jgi:hypothetical protein